MEIYLNTGHFFAVPSAVAEHFLKLASGDQLKVLLYVLCHADEVLTAEQIAAQCGVQPFAVEEALAFWQSVNIIRGSAEAAPAEVRTAAQSQAAEPVRVPETAAGEKEAAAPTQKSIQLSSTVWVIAPSEMAQYITEDKQIADMFSLVSLNAGRLLKPAEQKCLLWMHIILGLSTDCISMLVAYFIRKCKFNIKLMEETARRWVEQGIITHELAQQDVQKMEESWSYTGRIQKIFGMEKKPTPEQQMIIDKWQSSRVSFELIRIAYDQTRNKIGDKVNLGAFKYTDSIIDSWETMGIRTVEAAKKDIQWRESAENFTGMIMRLFGMRQKPIKKQQDYIDEWAKLGLSPELIQYAVELTRMRNGDKISFPYLDSILRRWAAAGIQTVEAAEQDEAAFQAAKQKRRPAAVQGGKGKTSRRTQISSIDPDEIEKLIGAY